MGMNDYPYDDDFNCERRPKLKTPEEALRERMRAIGMPPRYIEAELKQHPLMEKMFDPLASYYIYGKTGTGKTHLVCAMLKHKLCGAVWPGSMMFIPMRDMLERIRASYDQRPDPNRVRYYGDDDREIIPKTVVEVFRDTHVLAIDDVGGGGQVTAWVMEQFFGIIDDRYNQHDPTNPKKSPITYITSNLGLGELAKGFDSRVASRLHEMCTLFEVKDRNRRVNLKVNPKEPA